MALLAAGFIAFPEGLTGFRITAVTYQIEGLTRVYPLKKAVPVDTDSVFPDENALAVYVSDLKKQLENQRVLEFVDVALSFGAALSDGTIPVSLSIHTVDTWNIIGLPYPKYDSNNGFQLKMKLKDYNFSGLCKF